MKHPLCLIGLLLVAGTAACDDATFKVKYAPGYQPAKASVSVLGVFRGGRMNFDTWSSIGGAVSKALGSDQTCEPAYSERLQHENEDLFAAFDEETRNDGITEELLAKLEPWADGDVILTISVHGALVTASSNPNQDAQQQGPGNAPPTPTGGPSLGKRRTPERRGPPRVQGKRSLDFIAQLYDKRQHTMVARLDMSYEGLSNDEAVKRFAAAVGTLAPGSGCRGWSWSDKKTLAPAPAPIAPAAPPAVIPAPLQDGP